jgi:hypothetical protein
MDTVTGWLMFASGACFGFSAGVACAWLKAKRTRRFTGSWLGEPEGSDNILGEWTPHDFKKG